VFISINLQINKSILLYQASKYIFCQDDEFSENTDTQLPMSFEITKTFEVFPH
jgi:hypothetical protein